ncbi:hypothetical protein RHSIM_Rhsim10G0168400 [Rhododendron simsii]|uniref:Uncharacterized protein n=1 Tax=Rhododendron simsii TaxID=118357 RepID=A0A834LCP5_RHOSS|nr:hypothetical protein RHSIM_Rhsim10G0168400 [Rhododendron simsii]
MDGSKRTKIEAFPAYIWKVMVRVIDESHPKCKMGWLVDGRTRMCKDLDTMSNYIGNDLSLPFGEASKAELETGGLTDIAKICHDVISKVTNWAHFLDLIDWIECQRPGLMFSKVVRVPPLWCLLDEGYKSQWPELKGVRAVTAKQIIEKENPFVKAWIYPEGSFFMALICSKRVLLLTPANDCPNGRVSNSPFVR